MIAIVCHSQICAVLKWCRLLPRGLRHWTITTTLITTTTTILLYKHRAKTCHRHCNVVKSHLRQYNVVSTFLAHWAIMIIFINAYTVYTLQLHVFSGQLFSFYCNTKVLQINDTQSCTPAYNDAQQMIKSIFISDRLLQVPRSHVNKISFPIFRSYSWAFTSKSLSLARLFKIDFEDKEIVWYIFHCQLL